MGFIDRIGDILGSNINALLDKAEDPVKQADYFMEKYMKELAECKQDTAAIAAQAKARKREMDEAQKEVDKLSAMAAAAVKAGNDDDARTILARKQTAATRLATATQNYQTAQAQAEKMIQVHNKLVSDIEVCRARVQNIKATAALAKNQEKVSGMMEKYGQGTAGSSKLARAEEKAQAKLDKAEASIEMGFTSDPVDDLEAKYGAGAPTAVEDELAALKAELGQ